LRGAFPFDCVEGISAWPSCVGRRSRHPPGDAGNNLCRRQGDPVVAPTSTARGVLAQNDRGDVGLDGPPGADVEQPEYDAGGLGGRGLLTGRQG
jgi:hypothetical protein